MTGTAQVSIWAEHHVDEQRVDEYRLPSTPLPSWCPARGGVPVIDPLSGDLLRRTGQIHPSGHHQLLAHPLEIDGCGAPATARRLRGERAITTQRPQRSTRSQGQSVASHWATASARGTSRPDLSARTQDCTVTSHCSKAEGYR